MMLAQLTFDLNTLPQQLINGILIGAIYALIALGYTMVYGVLRLINFAHGEVYMFGAYIALFISWLMGFGPGTQSSPANTVIYIGVMLLGSMLVCAILGMLIDRFAYRPIRNQPRISVLITAIGVSLFLQYAGALFLPNSPPPSINENVNPFQSAINIQIRPASSELLEQLQVAQQIYTTNNDQLAAMTAPSAVDVNAEELADQELVTIRTRREAEAAQREVDFDALTIRIPQGQLLMLGTAIVLMLLLRQLVQRTSAGRAMRAVAQDFDSASLMGINVNKIITLTFIIGSALAGAAAMMTATFIGTPLTTFVGVQPGVKAFVAAVLGGIGSIPGAVLGGLVMGIAETMVVWVGLSSYRDAIALVILIVVLLFKPGGLMGSNAVEKV